MELVYNMRDSNLAKSLPWDCLLATDLTANDFAVVDEQKVCSWYFASGTEDNQILQISFDSGVYMYTQPVVAGEDFSQLWSGNLLYYTT